MMIGLVIPVFAATKTIKVTAAHSFSSFCKDKPEYLQIIEVRNGGPEWAWGDGVDYHIDLPVNLGYTAAVNIGLRTAKAIGCDHYIVGSADIIVEGDWIQPLMQPGISCPLEAGAKVSCEHEGACPFWGGMYSFPQALLDDVGFLPIEYAVVGDAAFACKAAVRGWAVGRADLTVQHWHPSAANKAADPKQTLMHDEAARLKRQYSPDICALLAELRALSPLERLERTSIYRSDR